MQERNKKTFAITKKVAGAGLVWLVFILAGIVAFRLLSVSPLLLIRHVFDKEAARVNTALAKHLPGSLEQRLNQSYDASDKDAVLDVYYTTYTYKMDLAPPVIVWVHGGGFVSPNREAARSYCKLLAFNGYTVVSLGYSVAPEKTYPAPLLQFNKALAYLKKHCRKLHFDSTRFILAGDADGALTAAQTANAICNPAYANRIGIVPALQPSQLSGLILYGGLFDVEDIDQRDRSGRFWNVVLASYTGTPAFRENGFFKPLSILRYVTGAYPPCFISAGSADPLVSQSQAFARKLASVDVKVDTLFFPGNRHSAISRQYQFHLDSKEGKIALERSLLFLKALGTKNDTERRTGN
jgi:acetyl esterase/lipase